LAFNSIGAPEKNGYIRRNKLYMVFSQLALGPGNNGFIGNKYIG
jgi:hypothetical protein